jgi:lipopolysaccharide biosynthesis glycosyltransferase
MDRTEPIVVVCCTNANYVRPLAAMVRSLLANKNPASPVALYVFDGGVPEEDKARLRESWPPDALEVRWMKPDHAAFSGLPLWGVWPPIAYSRILMAEALPASLHKAIWLDSEMIVQGDIAELWNTDLGDRPLLAVQDLVVPYVSSRYGLSRHRELGLPADAKYFNAGVMVVNLDWWRRNQVARKVLEYLRENRDSVCLLDQDGLNAVLSGHWGELDPRWNQIASVAGRPFLKVTHLDPAQYRQVVHDPWIVHYAGFWKPWNYHNRNASRALYFRYLDLTAWTGWRPKPTLRSYIRGLYESRLRNILYPAEHLRMLLLRKLTRRAVAE